MKQVFKRLAIIAIILCVICIPISMEICAQTANVYATINSADSESKNQVKQLINYLTGRTNTIGNEFDINSDKTINAADLSLLKKQIILSAKDRKTVTTTTATTMEKEVNIVKEVLNSISVTDTKVPIYNGNLYEDVENVFLFKTGEKIYAYTLLSNNSECFSAADLLLGNEKVGGMHIWLYGGKVKTRITEDEPANDKLKSYSKLSAADIMSVARILSGRETVSKIDISNYDYTLNGSIDRDDLKIMLQYRVCNPKSLFWKSNDEAFINCFKDFPLLPESTNVVLIKTDNFQPVEFAYNIPTGGINDSSFDGVITEFPVQVLPIEVLDEISSKYEEDFFASDQEHDYLIWESSLKKWAFGSNAKSSNWEFKAGYYVFVLDSNGKYILKWINQ